MSVVFFLKPSFSVFCVLRGRSIAVSRVIVTKDADFSDRILVSSPPPWIVHLRFGNMRRTEFHRFLSSVWKQVESLLPANKLICVYSDRIEAFA